MKSCFPFMVLAVLAGCFAAALFAANGPSVPDERSEPPVVRGTVVLATGEGLWVLGAGDAEPTRHAWAALDGAAFELPGEVLLPLSNGDRMSGRIVAVSEGSIGLVHPLLGELRVPVAALGDSAASELSVTEVVSEALDTGVREVKLESEFAKAVQDEVESDTILEPTDWTGSFALLGSLRAGQVDSSLLTLEGRLERTWASDRFTSRASYSYGETESETVANAIFTEAKWSHYYTEDFYSYAQLSVEWDEVQNIDLRAIGGIGGGYVVWNGEGDHRSFEIEGGISGIYEKFSTGESADTSPALRLASTYRNIFWADAKFLWTTELVTPMDDFGDYIFRTLAELTMPIADSWNLRNSIEWELQGEAPAGTQDSDLRIQVGITYTF